MDDDLFLRCHGRFPIRAGDGAQRSASNRPRSLRSSRPGTNSVGSTSPGSASEARRRQGRRRGASVPPRLLEQLSGPRRVPRPDQPGRRRPRARAQSRDSRHPGRPHGANSAATTRPRPGRRRPRSATPSSGRSFFLLTGRRADDGAPGESIEVTSTTSYRKTLCLMGPGQRASPRRLAERPVGQAPPRQWRTWPVALVQPPLSSAYSERRRPWSGRGQSNRSGIRSCPRSPLSAR